MYSRLSCNNHSFQKNFSEIGVMFHLDLYTTCECNLLICCRISKFSVRYRTGKSYT